MTSSKLKCLAYAISCNMNVLQNWVVHVQCTFKPSSLYQGGTVCRDTLTHTCIYNIQAGIMQNCVTMFIIC